MDEHLLDVYARLPVSFTHGDGVWVYDSEGNKYLDCLCGIAVTGLGHNFSEITKTIKTQAEKLLHISNVVEIPEQAELSNLLVDEFGADARVFVCNSGAESVETLIKLARLYGHSKNIDSPKVLVMSGGFHGRTMGCISASSNPKLWDGFEPLLAGFEGIEYNNLDSLSGKSDDKNIVAVLLEPIQGEGGIKVPDENYLTHVREICDKNSWLMLVDEIQAGMGRTGKMFAHQHNGIVPDGISLAKGLANGVPIGAAVIREPYYELFKSGSHGSTFGGNPLSSAAACATIKALKSSGAIENANKQGQAILKGLVEALKDKEHVVEVRGKGLMIGIELDRAARGAQELALKYGILLNTTNINTLRILPPLIIKDSEVKRIIEKVPEIIKEFTSK